MDNQRFEKLLNNFVSYCEKDIKKIDEYKEKLEQARLEEEDDDIEKYQRKLNEAIVLLKWHESHVKYMRPEISEDLEERKNVFLEFPKMVKNSIPDNIPIVFHGTNNIGIVLEIIRSGGLLTPEERNVGYRSQATQIDVTYKNNIRVSCEFAEPGLDKFMPYGAIFVFTPLETEVEKVIKTVDSSEVFGGVAGVNFKENPSRLIGIITTTESKPIIKQCCIENGWNQEKVFTHNEFVSKCIEKYGVLEERKINK